MSTIHHQLELNKLQQSLQQARYRAGISKLDEQFEPGSDYLRKAIQAAALYGIPLDEAEAEAAIECLFEINPQACGKLLSYDFAPEDHAALVQSILCDRYPLQLASFSIRDAQRVTAWIKQSFQKSDQLLSWEKVELILELYLETKYLEARRLGREN